MGGARDARLPDRDDGRRARATTAPSRPRSRPTRASASTTWSSRSWASATTAGSSDARVVQVEAGDAGPRARRRVGGPVARAPSAPGTGMVCFGWKGGIGTASRRVASSATVGVLVLANFGVGAATCASAACRSGTAARPERGRAAAAEPGGSCIAVVATDAPLAAAELERARPPRRPRARAHRVGRPPRQRRDLPRASSASGRAGRRSSSTTLFAATVDATEEAVVNALWAAEDTVGREGRVVPALPRRRTSWPCCATALSRLQAMAQREAVQLDRARIAELTEREEKKLNERTGGSKRHVRRARGVAVRRRRLLLPGARAVADLPRARQGRRRSGTSTATRCSTSTTGSARWCRGTPTRRSSRPCRRGSRSARTSRRRPRTAIVVARGARAPLRPAEVALRQLRLRGDDGRDPHRPRATPAATRS